MPNWCNNDITLTHKDPAMIERAAQALARGELLQEFFPCPQPLLDTTAGSHGDPDAQANLETLEDANLHAYGARNWYDWCVANWGTKWDVGTEEDFITRVDANTLQASFDSAWSPPCTAYEKLTDLGFYVKAFYLETGMCFCGVWEGDKDNGFFDDYVEYGGETSKTVREAVGEELDDHFDLTQMLEEFEEEN